MNVFGRFALRVAARHLPAEWWARYLAARTTRKASDIPLKTDTPLRFLALYHPGFRGDLEALADSGQAEVYLFPAEWQTRLVMAFYGPSYQNREVMKPPPGSRFEAAQKELTRFYDRIAPAYFRRQSCDCAISFHIRIPADVDFGRAIRRLGIPYCTIYREGLVAASGRVVRHMRQFFDRLGSFQGDHFLVHNESARDLCVTEGYSPADRTWALGCMRMDGFVRDIAAGAFAAGAPSGVAVLFPVAQPFADEDDEAAFYRDFYRSLVGFFAAHPEYRLIVKPKPKNLPRAQAQMDAALEGSGIDWRAQGNVDFDPDLDVHEAFRIADVVLGLNSTVLLEAGVAGKPVVAPLFPQTEAGPVADSLRFADAYRYFDVACDGQTLCDLLEARMRTPTVDPALMAGRREMFEKYVTSLDGNSVSRYIAFFRELVDARSSGAGPSLAKQAERIAV